MPVKVKCSGCSTVVKAPDRARGKAIKCPKCGKGIRVPAQSAARPKQRAVRQSADDDDFLGGFDLGHVEDRTARVCPKCGAIAGDEDVDCPSCGADLLTGGKGKKQRARANRKGAAPSEYYAAAARDAGAYFMEKLGLVWKSTFILSIFPVLTLLCVDFFIWCHNWPPRMFWLFVATVCGLFTPGWFWYVQNQFVLRVLEPKRERYPVRMETFSAVSLGIKSVFWSLFFGMPLWIVFGGIAGLLAFTDSTMGAMITLIAGGLLFNLIVLISWPIVQAHFAMPITLPGWMFHKVLPDVARNFGPCLYAAAIAFGTFLPVAGVIVGAAIVTSPKHATFQTTLMQNSRFNEATEALAIAEENGDEPPAGATEAAEGEPPAIDWSLLLWPMAAQIPIALGLSLWMVYNQRLTAYFVKLFHLNIENLLAHEKDYEYKSLAPHEQEELERQRGPLDPNSVKTFALLGVVFAALGGVGMALTFGKEVGYIGSFAATFLVIGLLLNLVASLLMLSKAFRKSPKWGWSKRIGHDFQLWLMSGGFLVVGGILIGIRVAMAKWAEAAKEAEAAEGAEQALHLIEAIARFLC